MCDREHFEDLDGRVDSLENRLSVVETTVLDMRTEMTKGFSDLKSELSRIYEERAKWSSWAREHLGLCLKWAGAIILAACGITQISNIIEVISKIH